MADGARQDGAPVSSRPGRTAACVARVPAGCGAPRRAVESPAAPGLRARFRTGAGRMTLSVVIVMASDTVRRPAHAGHLRHCLHGLRLQRHAPALDIVVPHLPGVSGIEALTREFPDVRFFEVSNLPPLPRGPYRDHHDDLRSRGLEVTRGPVVAMLEDHEVPDPHWCVRI